MERDATADSLPAVSNPQEIQRDFLLALFSSFEKNQVRYCVLHSWQDLPDTLESDLDIAVDPDDRHKVTSAFQQLQVEGYALVGAINYFINAYAFQFCRPADLRSSKINLVSVDIIFGHQRGAFPMPSAKELTTRRLRHGAFWIPSPDAEFTYLLARRASKGSATLQHERRLQDLIAQLGPTEPHRLAAQLLPTRLIETIFDACANGELNETLAQIKTQIRVASFSRNPFRLTLQTIREKARLLRRWLRPTGLFIAVLGPDGSGKSTLIQNLIQQIGPSWRATDLFHWRPMLLWRQVSRRDTTQPHSIPQRNSVASSIRVFAHLLDYWAGYWLAIRPSTARTGLVIFDRYFDDMIVDPKRYRYGGPVWLLRLLRHFVPKPDLTLVLDAPEEIVLSRKQEIAPAEVARQRQLYLECARRNPSARIIDTTGSIEQVSNKAISAITEFLSHRVQGEYPQWVHASTHTAAATNLVQETH
jgi:thymidylate kinase